MTDQPKCPACDSEAVYKYGKTRQGKQRFLCLNCNRQFVLKSAKMRMKNSPRCPACGKKMHVYMHEADGTRFRCSDYPLCRTFIKVPNLKDDQLREVHHDLSIL
jgi:DNA-directed RNA polymerase subunit RPC12/RpoP